MKFSKEEKSQAESDEEKILDSKLRSLNIEPIFTKFSLDNISLNLLQLKKDDEYISINSPDSKLENYPFLPRFHYRSFTQVFNKIKREKLGVYSKEHKRKIKERPRAFSDPRRERHRFLKRFE